MEPRSLVASFALVLTCATLGAQDVPAPERYASARAVVAGTVERGATPALSVAVMEGGEVVWAEGFGLADVERGTPATADTIYRLASISKPFTATAAMLLVERGLLDLDVPVNRYLEPPGVIAYAGRADAITLRRLMNHTAGLPTHWSFFYAGVAPPPRAETIRRYGFAAWEPGTRTNYSNLAFGIVDHVIARVAERSYRDFLVAEVLDPLGMTRTDVGVRPGHEADAAVGYVRDVAGRFVPVVDYGFDHDGASAVRSSALDLMRFAQLHSGAGDSVLSAETLASMRERHGREAGSGFGIAWGVGDVRGTAAVRHTGGMPGVSTVLNVFPERRAAVAVLANAGARGAVNRSLGAILDVLLGPEAPRETAADAPADDADRRDPPSGTWRGAVEHFDGPVPLELTIPEDGAPRVRLGELDVREYHRREADAGRVSVHFDGLLRTTRAFHGTPRLELELEPDADGWEGLLYAVGPATFRLPHHVRLARAAPKPEGTRRVVTYNVLVGFHDYSIGDPYLPGVQRRERVAAWLAAQAPDVVAFQEMNGYTKARLRAEAAAWGHGHVALLKEDGYPVALTSREPIEVVARIREGLHHGFLHVRTGGIDYVVVHLVPFEGVERKLRELEPVVAAYREAVDARRPIVLLGDFNSITVDDVSHYSDAAIERYRKWKWALDDGRPSETALGPVLEAGAADLWSRRRPEGEEMPLPRIDFVFTSPELAERCTACRWLPEPALLRRSDHPPVVADFAWPPR